MDYCNAKMSKLLDTGDITLNEKKRAAIINSADALMAKDIPTIPLYQKPTFLVFSKKVHGMKDNPTLEGPTWNTEAWWKG
jgi:peptide/nickel transport system substrate-binding protein